MDDLEWLGPVAPHLRALGAVLQPWVDALLKAPESSAWALVILGALMMVLGRQGQRAVTAGAVTLAVAWLQRKFALHLPGPPFAVALGAGAAAGIFPRPARSALFAAAGAAGGVALGAQLGMAPLLPAIGCAALGFAISWFNETPAQIVLPPLGAALALTGGAARLCVQTRAHHPQLGNATWLLLLSTGLAVVLVPIALEREAVAARHRKKRAASDEQKKKEAEKAAQKEKMARYLGKAKAG